MFISRLPRCLTFSKYLRAFRAFSLLELLVVIAIMAIMLGLMAGVGPGWIKAGAMSGSLSQVASAVSLARSEAVMSRKPAIFVLAPTNPLDERSYRSYAILRATEIHGTNYEYVRRWEKLPQGVLFQFEESSNLWPTNLPYPNDAGSSRPMKGIVFSPGGGLDDEKHPHGTKPVIALQSGVRMTPDSPAEFQGNFQEDLVLVERLSGKVLVKRLEVQ